MIDKLTYFSEQLQKNSPEAENFWHQNSDFQFWISETSITSGASNQQVFSIFTNLIAYKNRKLLAEFTNQNLNRILNILNDSLSNNTPETISFLDAVIKNFPSFFPIIKLTAAYILKRDTKTNNLFLNLLFKNIITSLTTLTTHNFNEKNNLEKYEELDFKLYIKFNQAMTQEDTETLATMWQQYPGLKNWLRGINMSVHKKIQHSSPINILLSLIRLVNLNCYHIAWDILDDNLKLQTQMNLPTHQKHLLALLKSASNSTDFAEKILSLVTNYSVLEELETFILERREKRKLDHQLSSYKKARLLMRNSEIRLNDVSSSDKINPEIESLGPVITESFLTSHKASKLLTEFYNRSSSPNSPNNELDIMESEAEEEISLDNIDSYLA